MSRRRVAQAAGIASVVAGLTVILLLSRSDPYVVRAEFKNASGLRKDFRVTIGGVSVGKISKVTLSRRDTAIATLDIDRSAGPVGRDAQATIVPTNLLGEKVVELAPGDLRNAAPSGTTIPEARTSTPVELDDVFNTFDTPTRTALAVFFVEQGDALLGRGHDLGVALQQMPPALDDARRLLSNLSVDNRSLGRLVQHSDRITATFARERAPLGQIVTSAGNALDSLGSRETALSATVKNAPGAVRELGTSLRSLQRAATPLAPAALGLRQAAPALDQTLRELPSFTAAARPALRTIGETAPSLRRLAAQGTPVVRRLGPAAAGLATFSRDADQAVAGVHEARDDLMGMLEGWARATQTRDALGHVFRVEATVTGDPSALLKDYLDPATGQKAKRPGSGAPSTAATAPAISSPAVHIGGITIPALHLPKVTQTVDSVTKGLLDFLLKP